jgi:hypothetical protein
MKLHLPEIQFPSISVTPFEVALPACRESYRDSGSSSRPRET